MTSNKITEEIWTPIEAWSAIEMIADAIEQLFGPIASLESSEASLLRGPEFHHRAEGIIEALQRVKDNYEAEIDAWRWDGHE